MSISFNAKKDGAILNVYYSPPRYKWCWKRKSGNVSESLNWCISDHFQSTMKWAIQILSFKIRSTHPGLNSRLRTKWMVLQRQVTVLQYVVHAMEYVFIHHCKTWTCWSQGYRVKSYCHWRITWNTPQAIPLKYGLKIKKRLLIPSALRTT